MQTLILTLYWAATLLNIKSLLGHADEGYTLSYVFTSLVLVVVGAGVISRTLRKGAQWASE